MADVTLKYDYLAEALAEHELEPELAGALSGADDPAGPAPEPARIEEVAAGFDVDPGLLQRCVREARLMTVLGEAGVAKSKALFTAAVSIAGGQDLRLALERLESRVRGSGAHAATTAARVVLEGFDDPVPELLRLMRQAREAQATGPVDLKALGLGLVAALADRAVSTTTRGPWVSVKAFGDNTWKQPRPHPPFVLLVIDTNDEFDPASPSQGPTGPAEAQRFVRSATGPAVVILTTKEGTGLRFKHLYALGSDPLAGAVLAGAPAVWRTADPNQFQEVVVPPDVTTGHGTITGPWRLAHPPVGASPSGFVELPLDDGPDRGLMPWPGQCVILVEQNGGTVEAHGMGRVHHVTARAGGGHVLILDAFVSFADRRLVLEGP